ITRYWQAEVRKRQVTWGIRAYRPRCGPVDLPEDLPPEPGASLNPERRPDMVVKAYGTPSGDKPLAPLNISRRAPGAHDVQIGILYCGICHSDLHQARGEWAGTRYPCVPGHEIVGRVAAVGASVTSHKAGDLVGVGCIVDSCQHCAECDDGFENYCNSMVGTYNGPTADAPGHTLGGYSQEVVVHERYVLKITHPEAQLAAVAPLLC